MNPAKRGEIWLVELGQPKDDHEQAGRRPAVVVQTDDGDLSVTIGGVNAQVLYAGPQRVSPGVDQIKAVIRELSVELRKGLASVVRKR